MTSTDISPPTSIRIGQTSLGRGVIAAADIAAGETIEVCPVLELGHDAGGDALTNYVVKVADDDESAALMLGYGSLYNHSDEPNAEYTHLADDAYAFGALRDIAAGEEITISYGDAWWETRELEPERP